MENTQILSTLCTQTSNAIVDTVFIWPTQPPIQWVLGALSPGVKRQWREADHSPPASAEVKKIWIYTSTPLYAFMAKCLIS
jgi:hypothetical protein